MDTSDEYEQIFESKSSVKVRGAICHGSVCKQLEQYWKEENRQGKHFENNMKNNQKPLKE